LPADDCRLAIFIDSKKTALINRTMFFNKNRFRLLLAAPLLCLLLGGCNPTGVDEFDGDPGKAKLMVYNVMPSFYVYQGVNREGRPITVTNGLPLQLYLDGVKTFAAPLGYNNLHRLLPRGARHPHLPGRHAVRRLAGHAQAVGPRAQRRR
jgi:hypothetical protein